MNVPPQSLIYLFLSFLKLGSTAFGGPAMVAYMRNMAVEKNHWLDDKTARDGIALCQTIPGATAMQMSAYIGFRAGGVGGAVASFIGFGLPSFLLMIALSALYARMHALPSVGLLLTVTVRFALNIPWDLPRLFIAGGALTALLIKVDILWVVLVGTGISWMAL